MIQIQSFTFGPFQENTYILHDENRDAILIDPGMYDAHEAQQFFQYIDQHQLSPVLLLNTHTHLDHLSGNAVVLQRYQIPYTFHQADHPVFEHQLDAARMYGFQLQPSPQPDYFIQEGETISLGKSTLDILFTPGHSPGSVCFYNREAGWLIGGDVLFRGSVGRTDLPGGDWNVLFNSIQEKLFILPDETVVHSGHGPSTSIGYEKQHNPFVGTGRNR